MFQVAPDIVRVGARVEVRVEVRVGFRVPATLPKSRVTPRRAQMGWGQAEKAQ